MPIALLILLFFSGNLISCDKEYLRTKIYCQIVPAIDMVLTIKEKKSQATLRAHQNFNSATYAEKIDSIKNEFKNIENDLRLQEENAVRAICKDYHLTDRAIDDCFHVIKELKMFGQEYMKSPQKNIVHDPTIAPPLYEAITQFLEKNGIHPKSINLENLINEDHAHGEHKASAQCPCHYWKRKGNHVIIIAEKPSLDGKIMIFPSLAAHSSLEEQNAIIAHECKHIKEQHSITRLALQTSLDGLFQNGTYDNKALMASENWKKLVAIQEAQADIFSCLDDASICSVRKKIRSAGNYPGVLYESHYYQITYIYKLWKQLAWLSKHAVESKVETLPQ